MHKILISSLLLIISTYSNAGAFYTVYNGSENGITVRDSTTLNQTAYFGLDFAVDNVAAGDNNDMFLTSGNSIYHYSNTGTQLNSFSWGDTSISYEGISVAAGGNSFYTVYNGSENGITVRDTSTLNQTAYFGLDFIVDNVTAGDNNDMFLTSGNSIYHYSNTGTQLNSFFWGNTSISYEGITFAAGGNSFYAVYNGSENGITVRDSTTLNQTAYFGLDFAVDNVTAGDNNDMFLTSGNSIYHYSNTGTQLNSFSWGNTSISYEGISFAATAIPEPSTLAIFALGVFGLISCRSRKHA
ncbi:PEP-CTERM sorting domain-containing protein [Colwelliaceae bacterium MEBiC 14330]